MSIHTEYRFGSLADLAQHLRNRSAEIKDIHQDRKIDKARIAARAEAFIEIAEMLDNATIGEPK